jgi:hypothetical protein
MIKTEECYWTVESAKIMFYELMVIDDTQLKYQNDKTFS